ncbi:hypothetical protein JCM8097_000049 [Rhodosporidiobolus ruineniae]
MSLPPRGPCCVCSKEMTQRCSACGKAGFDLFLCSTEHQRMVWFAHKQVCGPRSKPFQFPLLSKEAARNATSHLKTPYKLGDGGDVTLKDALTNLCFSFDRSFLLTFPLSSLISSLQVGPTPLPQFTLDQRNELLCHIHHASFAIRRRTIPSLSSNRSKLGTFDVPLEFLHPTAVLAKFARWHYLAHQDRPEHSPPLLNAIDPYKEASHVALITAAAGQIVEVTEKMRTSQPRERDEVVKLLDQIGVHSLPSA